MPRKMQLFHKLDEKIAKTFLADIYCKVLYSIEKMRLESGLHPTLSMGELVSEGQ